MVKATADIPKIQDYIAKHYKPNLRELINLHRSRGENVIMVSQPANPALVKWQQPDTYVAAWKTSLGQWAMRWGRSTPPRGKFAKKPQMFATSSIWPTN
jgi:hypothetical protein